MGAYYQLFWFADTLLGENERRTDFDKEKIERLTFNTWADRYLTLATEKRTYKDDVRLLKPLRAEFGSLPLEEITYARIKEFALKLRQRPIRQTAKRSLSPAGCNRKLALLRHVLRMAWKEGLLDRLPAVELFPEDNERDRVLTEEEFAHLFEQAPPTLQPILICAWETGMRRGEIVSLTWPQVNLKANCIALDSQDTKTGRKRLIPISQRLRETLLALRQPPGRSRRSIRRCFSPSEGSLLLEQTQSARHSRTR